MIRTSSQVWLSAARPWAPVWPSHSTFIPCHERVVKLGTCGIRTIASHIASVGVSELEMLDQIACSCRLSIGGTTEWHR